MIVIIPIKKLIIGASSPPVDPIMGWFSSPSPFIPPLSPLPPFFASETSNLVKPTSISSCQSIGFNLIQCYPSSPMKTLLQYTSCETLYETAKPPICDDLHAGTGDENIGLAPRPLLCSKLGISPVTSCLRSLSKHHSKMPKRVMPKILGNPLSSLVHSA